jgi:competence protein ComEA
MIRRVAFAALAVTSLASFAPARAAPTRRLPPITITASDSSHADVEGVVNLNDASEEVLTRLPGIGPAKARAIVEHRRSHPFRRVDELTKVKGIGHKTFGRLRPYVSIAGPSTLDKEVKLRR